MNTLPESMNTLPESINTHSRSPLTASWNKLTTSGEMTYGIFAGEAGFARAAPERWRLASGQTSFQNVH